MKDKVFQSTCLISDSKIYKYAYVKAENYEEAEKKTIKYFKDQKLIVRETSLHIKKIECLGELI